MARIADLNFRKNLWKWGQSAQAVMKNLLRHVDIVIANEEDIQLSLGIAAGADVHAGKLDPRCYESLTNAVLSQYSNLKAIAVTMRESKNANVNCWSAALNGRHGFEVSRSYEITDIVDRAGSGDSFAAGLIWGIQASGIGREALEFATAASCLKHSIPGDYNRVTVDEVQHLLANGGSGRVQR